jgi:hypothetical protein
MGFVDNRYTKRDLTDDIEVPDQSVVRCHEHVELQKLWSVGAIFVVPFIFSKNVTPDALPVVINAALQVGPAVKLPPPVLHR